jgi:hypothetical protein
MSVVIVAPIAVWREPLDPQLLKHAQLTFHGSGSSRT